MTQEQLLQDYVAGMNYPSIRDSYGYLGIGGQYGTDHQILYFVPYKGSGGHYEFPSFMFVRARSFMDMSSTVSPVYIDQNVYSFSTLYKMLTLLRATNSRMLTINLDGNIYYANPGVILDSKFRILLLSTTLMIDSTHYEYNLYIHPDIFIESSPGKMEKLLKKYIVKVSHNRRWTLCIKDVTSMFTLSAYTGINPSPTRENDLYIEDRINRILMSETSQLIKHMSIDDE